MVDLAVRKFVEQKAEGKFVTLTDNTLVVNLDKELGNPVFDVEVKVQQNRVIDLDYLVSGYVGEYGDIRVCSVKFERTIKRDGETDFHTEHEFLHGLDLDEFKFDH